MTGNYYSERESNVEEPEALEDDHRQDESQPSEEEVPDQDQTPAEPVEQVPDPEQAAEPVPNVGQVAGRRNPNLPSENASVPPTN